MIKEMVNYERKQEVYFLLLEAAKNRQCVSYKKLYDLFDDETPFPVMNATLEAASESLALMEDAIYSALMARDSNNCPGSGFYDVYRIHRAEEYEAIAGSKDISKLSDREKKKIAKLERERVYEHAVKDN